MIELVFNIVLYFVIVLFGLVIGSFLNVCIYRIPEKKSIISPPSSCGSCGARLGIPDLVPVFSYLFLKGKCRHCGAPYSARYAVVEALNACIYMALFWRFTFSVEFFVFSAVMSVMLVIFFIDTDHKIIPDKLVLVSLVIGIAYYVYTLVMVPGTLWWDRPAAFLGGGLLLLLIALLGALIFRKEAMGGGDVKLFAALGMILGIKLLVVAFYGAFIGGGIIAVIALASKKKSLKDMIAFGPFFVVGTFIALMAGNEVMHLWLGI